MEKKFRLILIKKTDDSIWKLSKFPIKLVVFEDAKVFFPQAHRERTVKMIYYPENSNFGSGKIWKKILVDLILKTNEIIWKLSKFTVKLIGLMDVKVIFWMPQHKKAEK